MARRETARREEGKNASTGNGAKLGFEATLWAAIVRIRGHMDAAEYSLITHSNDGQMIFLANMHGGCPAALRTWSN